MIIYKLNEINERIEQMNQNIKAIKEKGENIIQEDLQKYRSQQREINRSSDLTDAGKENQLDNLSRSYYDKYVEKGKTLIQQILDEYDGAIERVKELKQFDDERKIVNASKASETDVIKENTNLMYAIQLLNNIDTDYGHKELKDLLENSQESEKLLTLIKMKADKLNADGANTNELNSVIDTIKKFDTDYAAQLEESKVNSNDFYAKYEYPRVMNRIPIKELFEVDKVELKQFYAENRKSKDGINKFVI